MSGVPGRAPSALATGGRTTAYSSGLLPCEAHLGQGIAHFSDDTYLVAGSVTTSAVDHDIWTKRLTGADAQIWKPLVFAGLLGSIDEPRGVSINAFDQALIVGFETVVVQQDGKAVAVRQAWLKALHG